MRRIALWLVSTVAGLVLLFSYRPPATTVTAPSPPPAIVATAPAPTTSQGTTLDNGTFDGTLVQTTQGPVQVRITVANGRIVDVNAIVFPNDSVRHQQVSSYALPSLREAVLNAQSAEIDTVSGATDTSFGYLESLQAAIDAAHRA
ncbi:FMN-binding protein [Catelliglobosispora koreensis]|uniref:FMN-binding protein n=1 Tax=Catelliglobosispora koreensis TaxID=129052 RepID=UPI00035E83E6|nr:FMN-binding protein [Catelliglobosispora koreensis]